MADTDETIGGQIADLKTAAKTDAPSGGGGITLGKRTIIALFIVAGAFFAYVIWRQQRNAQVNAANQQGIAAIGADQTQNDALASEASQIAALQQSVTSNDAMLQAGINNAVSQAGAARADASAGLNILQHGRTSPPQTVNHIPSHAAPPSHLQVTKKGK